MLDGEVDLAVVMIAPNRTLLAELRIVLEPLVIDGYRVAVSASAGHPLVSRIEAVALHELAGGAVDSVARLDLVPRDYRSGLRNSRLPAAHGVSAAHRTTDFLVAFGAGVLANATARDDVVWCDVATTLRHSVTT
ncbi:MAG TPA: hypothetical protein VGS97_06435 [Actinocrinis sp.]|uniref:hypothetical protein n=1 Tax=Actinocrinis sp. TaxID=1920516 RepID=UPI002DDCFCA2|nr:hypothetical protein [Actinocrinis sp.]HEV2343709.1 hypothetical protein [Actinocrinis sp.]